MLALLIVGGTLGGLATWLGMRGRVAEIKSRSEQQERDAEVLRERCTDLTGRLHAAQTSLEHERKTAEADRELLGEAQAKLTDTFKALASEALSRNNESFLQLAQQNMARHHETAKGDLDKRRQAIGEIVAPLRDQLARYEKQIQNMERSRQEAHGALLSQVRLLDQTQKDLEKETSNLVRALRTPQVRGRWGEITLRRVAELAGMVAHCDFSEQTSVETDEGRRRPDMIVHLPGGGHVVVDAKTPLQAYLEAVEATSDQERRAALERHAAQLQTHMEALQRKDYLSQFQPAPDFVVLFVPGESFLSAALERKPHLMELGFQKRVILASPTNLISLLLSVAQGWRQEQLAENAKDISDLGRDLYDRLRTMSEHLAKLGSSLEGSVVNYNKAMRSMESRVLVQARRFTELGIHPKEEIKPIELIESTPQAPATDEADEAPETEVVESSAFDADGPS